MLVGMLLILSAMGNLDCGKPMTALIETVGAFLIISLYIVRVREKKPLKEGNWISIDEREVSELDL